MQTNRRLPLLLGSSAALWPAAAFAQRRTMMERLTGLATNAGFREFPGSGPASGLRYAAWIIGIFIGALLTFIGIVFLVLMIQAGLRWMLARGNEQDVEKAKQTIKNAAIGLLVVALSYAFVTLFSAIITQSGLFSS